MKAFISTLTTLGFAGMVAFGPVGCNNQTTTTKEKGATISSSTTKQLKLTADSEQTIHRGKTDKVSVSVKRSNFDEPVTISLTGLPKGIENVEQTSVIPAGSNSLTLTLRATNDAPLGDHTVTLNAEAPSVDKNAQTFVLRIKE